MFEKKYTAPEVLLLASLAAGAATLVCMSRDQLSKNITQSNAMFVAKGTPAPVVVDFAETLAGNQQKVRSL